MCLVDFELKKDGQIAKALSEEQTFFHEQTLHPLCVQDYTITERKFCVTSENVSIEYNSVTVNSMGRLQLISVN